MALLFDHMITATTECWCCPDAFETFETISMPGPLPGTYLAQLVRNAYIFHNENSLMPRRRNAEGGLRPRVVNYRTYGVEVRQLTHDDYRPMQVKESP